MHRRTDLPWPVLLSLTVLIAAGLPAAALADDMMEYIGDFTPPFFVHLLDVHLDGPYAYVPGFTGLTIYDVSNVASPSYVGRFQGQGAAQFYRLAGHSPTIFCGGRDDGIWVIDVSNPAAPTNMHIRDEGDTSFEGLLLDGADLYAAAHDSGLRIYDVTNPTAFSLRGSVPLANAWNLVKDGDWVYVANGEGGLAVINAADPNNPALVQIVPTSGVAQDVDIRGDRAFVAAGTGGVDIFDIQDRSAPVFLGNYDNGQTAFKISADPGADRVYVATWVMIDVIDVSNPAAPVRAGFEDTPVRAMGVKATADHVYVADWSSVRIYEFGPTVQPDISVSAVNVSFPVIPIGESADTTVTVTNTGGGVLDVTGVVSNHPDIVATPTMFTLLTDEQQDITLTATASAAKAFANVTIHSNDPDEGEDLHGVDYGTVGSLAPNFVLDDLAGVTHTRDDFLGEPFVMAFFASW